MSQAKKPFYKSKSKLAGFLAGIGLILPGIVSWLEGGVLPLGEIWTGIVAILGVWGIRDLPVLNRR